MANVKYFTDSSCSTQLSHNPVSITGTTLTAATLIAYPGTAPEGQELDYWMVSGKFSGLSDIKAEENLNVANYIVSDNLMLYPAWKTKIAFTPSAVSAVPLGNIVAPQGASIQYGDSYVYNNTIGDWILNNLSQENYEIVITPQDTDETLPATQITFTSGDSTFNGSTVQQIGSQLITATKNLQTSDNGKLPKTGGTMTGNLTMSNANIVLNTGTVKATGPVSKGFTEIGQGILKMSNIANNASYQLTYDVDDTTQEYALLYATSGGAPVHIVGVADPVNDTGVANRRYVLNAVGAATTDMRTYVDNAIEEKIADAIGGAY